MRSKTSNSIHTHFGPAKSVGSALSLHGDSEPRGVPRGLGGAQIGRGALVRTIPARARRHADGKQDQANKARR